MVTVEQLNLALLDLIKQGKESLQHRGISVLEDATLEEIIQKIKEIPIYDFNKSGVQINNSVIYSPYQPEYKFNQTMNLKTNNISLNCVVVHNAAPQQEGGQI